MPCLALPVKQRNGTSLRLSSFNYIQNSLLAKLNYKIYCIIFNSELTITHMFFELSCSETSWLGSWRIKLIADAANTSISLSTALVFLVCFLKMLVDYVLAAIVHLIRCTWIWKRHIAGSLNMLPSCKTTKQIISLLIRTAFPAMIIYRITFSICKKTKRLKLLMLNSNVVVSINRAPRSVSPIRDENTL